MEVAVMKYVTLNNGAKIPKLGYDGGYIDRGENNYE